MSASRPEAERTILAASMSVLRAAMVLVAFLVALLATGQAWAQPADASVAEAQDASAPSEAPAASAPPAPAEDSPPPPPASAHASASAPPSATAPAVVHLRERAVFTIRVPRGGQSPQDRARASSDALETLLDAPDGPPPRVEEQGPLAVVFVANTPIVTLGEDDAVADGNITLNVHAASVAASIEEALRLERKRSAIATSVFSFSLLVFSGLIAFFLFRRVGVIEDKVRAWMEAHPARVPAVRFGKIEVVSPPAVRGAIGIALRVGHRVAQVAIVYAWLIIALSLFDSTRDYTEKLTGFVVKPLSGLVGRVGSALPGLIVGIIAALAVSLVVRFVGLFFGSVGRGETKLGWLPSDLAGPTSVLVRAGIVLASLVAVSPLVTGSEDGAISRAGIAALVTVALACTPVLASGAVGVPIVFGRRLRLDDFVEAGGHAGRVRGVTLLELRLEDAWGCEIRVPHLMSLWHATRVVGRSPMVTIFVTIDSREPQGKVCDALLEGARKVSARSKIELVSIDADGARYRVSCPNEPGADLGVSVAEALALHAIPFGRSHHAARGVETKL